MWIFDAPQQNRRLMSALGHKRTSRLVALTIVRPLIATRVLGSNSRDASILGPFMSALGQKQTLGKVRLMSALPPKADIDSVRPLDPLYDDGTSSAGGR